MNDDGLPGGTLCAGRYVVGKAVAAGGLSTVYRATDDRDGRPVALKVLRRSLAGDPDAVASFAREADHAWALRHPGFVEVLARGWIGDRPFLALEFLEGESLAAALSGRYAGGAPWPEARRILRRAGTAVAHAHALGLVHADLKPGNIFLLEDGGVRILDLGAAQLIDDDSHSGGDRQSRPGRDRGSGFGPDRDPGLDTDRSSGLDTDGGSDGARAALTPAYASPEMLLGARAGPRDDVFSLAVIGYELVSGRHPFDGVRADRARALGLRPERPTRIPEQAWRTLRRGLDLRVERRPAAMAGFVAGLSSSFLTALLETAVMVPAARLARIIGETPLAGEVRRTVRGRRSAGPHEERSRDREFPPPG